MIPNKTCFFADGPHSHKVEVISSGHLAKFAKMEINQDICQSGNMKEKKDSSIVSYVISLISLYLNFVLEFLCNVLQEVLKLCLLQL